MFGRTLAEGLGKITFWLFYIGFQLTFFVQHFLGLTGMPRRVFTYLPNQGFDTMNMISSIGAFMMGVGFLLFLWNVVITTKKPKTAGNDPWEDGRTLEWTIPSPPPEYNFKQTPLVRGYDAWWKEKMDGNKEMTPAEPLGEIHMPNASILPFMMSVGLFIAGFGFMFAKDVFGNGAVAFLFNNYIIAGLGLLITFGCMFLRSVIDDQGYHIGVDELEDKGAKA